MVIETRTISPLVVRPAAQLSHRNFEEGDLDIDFGDWDFSETL